MSLFCPSGEVRVLFPTQGSHMNKKEMWQIIEPLLHRSLEAGLEKEIIIEFCDVSTGVFNRWLRTGERNLPIATFSNKLWYFFDLITDDLPPIRDMKTNNAEYGDLLARLVAFTVIDLDLANELCGLSGRREHVWVHLRGESVTNNPRITLEQLKNRYEPDLHAMQKLWLERLNGFSLEVNVASSDDEQLEESFPPSSAEEVVAPVGVLSSGLESDPVSVPSLELASNAEPEEVSDATVLLPQEAVDKLQEMRAAFEKTLPLDILLTVAGSLSAVLPHIRHLTGQFDKELVEEWLNEYFGADAATDIVEFLGYSLSQEEAEEAVLDVVESGDVVKRTAKALRQLAPDINALFEDDTSEGAFARERLRNEVGTELYNSLTVKLNAMRSFRAYEKARNGDVN